MLSDEQNIVQSTLYSFYKCLAYIYIIYIFEGPALAY